MVHNEVLLPITEWVEEQQQNYFQHFVGNKVDITQEAFLI